MSDEPPRIRIARDTQRPREDRSEKKRENINKHIALEYSALCTSLNSAGMALDRLLTQEPHPLRRQLLENAIDLCQRFRDALIPDEKRPTTESAYALWKEPHHIPLAIEEKYKVRIQRKYESPIARHIPEMEYMHEELKRLLILDKTVLPHVGSAITGAVRLSELYNLPVEHGLSM